MRVNILILLIFIFVIKCQALFPLKNGISPRILISSDRSLLTLRSSLSPNSKEEVSTVNEQRDKAESRTNQCPGAEKCSGAYRTGGCDGKGKIEGGIGTIPFLSWIPIKVYRPCPAYLEAGYAYRREGQTLEQVLFSEPSQKMKEKLEKDRLEEQLKRLQEETDDNSSNNN